ncbi:MAG TPA: 23S rRNA (pseudouridine(1915)-N(3))-methyltransferase RlmH [Burkholderiaceae bacterium]|jgi:23S rRNA (pseudouridine1915-N3)-methyltransferase|nr:23S rRNA (pseudouridine(1915)-N(3))-methyltransferase RlmH [Burkholderiaceae bacterium]
MRITVVAVGQRQPAWADAAVNEYFSRLPPDFKVELKLVKADPRSGSIQLARSLSAEAVRVRAAVPDDAWLIALDEHGKDWTTQQFADQLRRWRDFAHDIAFAIGGADGLDPGLKNEARTLLRVSSMTLPHALARVVLAEQLYRAASILAGHPYHRA